MLLLASQVYLPSSDFWILLIDNEPRPPLDTTVNRSLFINGKSLYNHVMVGSGTPVAAHAHCAVVPTCAVTWALGGSFIVIGTAKKQNKFRYKARPDGCVVIEDCIGVVILFKPISYRYLVMVTDPVVISETNLKVSKKSYS